MSDRSLKLEVLFKGLDNLTGPLKAMTGGAKKTQDAIRTLNKELKAKKDALKLVQDSLKTASGNVTQLLDMERKLENQVGDTTAALKGQREALGKLNAIRARAGQMKEMGGDIMAGGAGAVGAGLAVTAPVYMAYDKAKDLESAMADVRKVMNFPPDMMSQISRDFIDMSTRVPMTAAGLTQIAAAAARAGVGQKALAAGQAGKARSELLAFTEDAAKMGTAFDMTAEQAGETMAKWRTAFDMPQDKVRALGDQVNALTNKFGGTANAVTDIVTRVGPLGKVGGLAGSQIASMAQVLNSVGVESEIAATGIKNTLLALTKGESATKSQTEAFTKLGLNATEVAKRMQKDAGGTLTDVFKRIQGLSKDRQVSVLTDLFGSESVSAIAPLLSNLDKLLANLALVGDQSKYAGSMNAEFLARIATTEGATGLAKNAIDGLNIQLGTGLLPLITSAAQALTPLTNAVRNWAAEHPKLTNAIVLFLGIGGGLLVLLGGLAIGVGALTFAFGALGVTSLAALWPILAVIAAVAAVGAAAYLIIANWEPIKKWFGDLWAKMTSGPEGFFSAIADLFMTFTPLGWIIRAFQPVLDWLKSKFDLRKLGADIILGLVSGITGNIPAALMSIGKVAIAVKDEFKKILGIKSPSRVFAQLGGFVTEGLSEGLNRGKSTPIGRMRSIAGSMSGAFVSGLSITKSAGVMPAGMAANASLSMAGRPITINVYGAPGQSEKTLAEEVARQLRELMSGQSAARRSSFEDDDA